MSAFDDWNRGYDDEARNHGRDLNISFEPAPYKEGWAASKSGGSRQDNPYPREVVKPAADNPPPADPASPPPPPPPGDGAGDLPWAADGSLMGGGFGGGSGFGGGGGGGLFGGLLGGGSPFGGGGLLGGGGGGGIDPLMLLWIGNMVKRKK